MKNNTKLIMETWRRFLKEGPEGIGTDGMVLDADEVVNDSSLSPVEDTDLEGDIETIDSMRKQNNQPFDDEYNPTGDMYHGDPAHMGSQSSAPMLSKGDEYDDEYDEEEKNYYASRGGIPDNGEDTADETMMDDDSESFEDEGEDFDDYDSSEYYEDFPTG